MGKTIQAISLLLANRPSPAHNAAWVQHEADHGRAPNAKLRAGTLVICPLIALLQWQSEIARFTAEGALKVVVYHGSAREGAKALLQGADVVLTTYSIVEAEYRKMTAPEKVRCEECGKRFYPDKLRLHKRYFCGEGAALTAAQAKTARKGRAVAVGNESKRDRRARGMAIEEDGEATESESEEGQGDSDDEPLAKRVRRVVCKKGAGGGGNGKGKGKGKEGEGEDKYALIKARNKRLMAEAMGGGGGAAKAGGGTAKGGKTKKQAAAAAEVIEVSSGSSSSSRSEDEEEDEEEAKYARIKAANKRKLAEMTSGGKKGKSGGDGAGRGGSWGGKSAWGALVLGLWGFGV